MHLPHRVIRTALAAGCLALVGVAPALGASTVMQPLDGGTRAASISDVTLNQLTYAHADQINGGTLTLTVDDSSGSGLGWHVTVQSSALTYSGDYAGDSISAANIAIGTPGNPTVTAGQAVDPSNGPSSGSGGSLDTARTVISANAGYGQGSYSQSLPVTMTVPGTSRAGAYSSTLTVTISAGPGS